jgi:hypothetical protein
MSKVWEAHLSKESSVKIRRKIIKTLQNLNIFQNLPLKKMLIL